MDKREKEKFTVMIK